MARYRLAFQTSYLISHPDGVKQVLQDNAQNYTKDHLGYSILRWFIGNGLLTSQGDFWLRQQRQRSLALRQPLRRVQQPTPIQHQPFQHLLNAAGGTVRAGAVAKRLGVPVAMVDQLRHASRLLAIPDGRGYTYPNWQFEGRGVLAGLPTVLAALQGTDPWQQVAFVLTPQAALGDQRPLDQLRAGAVSAVVRVAQHAGAAVREAAWHRHRPAATFLPRRNSAALSRCVCEPAGALHR